MLILVGTKKYIRHSSQQSNIRNIPFFSNTNIVYCVAPDSHRLHGKYHCLYKKQVMYIGLITSNKGIPISLFTSPVPIFARLGWNITPSSTGNLTYIHSKIVNLLNRSKPLKNLNAFYRFSSVYIVSRSNLYIWVPIIAILCYRRFMLRYTLCISSNESKSKYFERMKLFLFRTSILRSLLYFRLVLQSKRL